VELLAESAKKVESFDEKLGKSGYHDKVTVIQMASVVQLTSEDRERIQAWLAKREWSPSSGNSGVPRVMPDEYLLGQVEEWESVVRDVEKGYTNMCFEDYTNDLTKRDLLQEMDSILSEAGRASFRKVLRPVDKRFLRATHPARKPLCYAVSGEPLGFWWWRVPLQMDKDLWQEMRGYLDPYSNRETDSQQRSERIEVALSPCDQNRAGTVLSRYLGGSRWQSILSIDATPEEILTEYYRPKTLSDRISEWSNIVSAVASGYELSMEDYTNDLTIRDLIEKVRQVLSPKGQQVLASVLRTIDEQFLRATYGLSEALRSAEKGEELGFWWYRVPKQHGKELAEWLQVFFNNR